jgi:hypothetical protein
VEPSHLRVVTLVFKLLFLVQLRRACVVTSAPPLSAEQLLVVEAALGAVEVVMMRQATLYPKAS